MASGSIDPDYIPEEEEEEDIITGPINICKAQDYTEKLGTIFNEFDSSVQAGDKDTLSRMLQEAKAHTAKTWDQMGSADMKTVLTSVMEPSCDTLRETLTERVTLVDSEEDLPTGQEILQKLPPQTPAVREHCISLFDDLAAATSHMSSAYTNLLALAKTCDEETFRTILKTSARPLVQINIPPKFLNPILEEKPFLEGKVYRDKLRQTLLP